MYALTYMRTHVIYIYTHMIHIYIHVKKETKAKGVAPEKWYLRLQTHTYERERERSFFNCKECHFDQAVCTAQQEKTPARQVPGCLISSFSSGEPGGDIMSQEASRPHNPDFLPHSITQPWMLSHPHHTLRQNLWQNTPQGWVHQLIDSSKLWRLRDYNNDI